MYELALARARDTLPGSPSTAQVVAVASRLYKEDLKRLGIEDKDEPYLGGESIRSPRLPKAPPSSTARP